MRTLAHFRPIEDNEKNKNAAASEPLNSRTNKLLCECSARSHGCVPVELVTGIVKIHRISLKSAYCICSDLYIYLYLVFSVAFRLYDLDRDDKISRDELLQVSGLVCHVNRMLSHSEVVLFFMEILHYCS